MQLRPQLSPLPAQVADIRKTPTSYATFSPLADLIGTARRLFASAVRCSFFNAAQPA
jgi:hypothetical protein